MSVFQITVSCFFVICVVKSVVSGDMKTCDIDKDMKNITIDTSQYCRNNICIYKCCPLNQILNNKRQCETVKKFKRFIKKIKYVNIPITKSLNGNNVTKSNKRLTKDFVFIFNKKFTCEKNAFEVKDDQFHIWENGTATFTIIAEGFEGNAELEPKHYCVDYRQFLTIENHTVTNRSISFVLSSIGDYQEDYASTYFISIGMLTSCFFFLLVLLVYGLLPPLHNIGGMVLMAYVSSLFLTYLVRAILPFAIKSLSTHDCKKISPVLYFAALSKFFWLNVMSFDLFWAFRGTLKCRAIHRKGEKVKFMWYCLYAWGIPLLITLFVVILDNIDHKKFGIYPPPFSNCFDHAKGIWYYLHIPIGIIIAVNTLLFLMTAYNIWLIKREIRSSPESRNTNKDINNFIMHMKLAVMMGVSWSIEILPNIPGSKKYQTWLSIVLNFYHVFIGVVIFFLFVFKKKILIMLCKKFHINNHLTNNLQNSYQYSKSGTEPKNSRKYTFKTSRNEGP